MTQIVVAGFVIFLLIVIGAGILLAGKVDAERNAEDAERNAENLKKQRDVKPSGNVLSAVDRLRKNRK